MNESSSNIAKMECINKHTVPEIQEEFKKGNLGISAAYEAAKLSPEEQKAVAKKTAEGGNVLVKEIVGKDRDGSKSSSKEKASEQEIQKEREDENPVEKLSRTEKAFRHKKILREWESQNLEIAKATKKVSNAIKNVSQSNFLPQNNWKDMEWAVFQANAIMHCADRVSEEDLYLLHDIMMRCQKKGK